MGKRPGMGGFDMQRIVKEAQKLQSEMARVERELDGLIVEGTSGGGMVTAQMSCSLDLKSIKIEEEAVDPEDVEMLQDLIVAAVNTAIGAAQNRAKEEMAKVTGGANLPFGL